MKKRNVLVLYLLGSFMWLYTTEFIMELLKTDIQIILLVERIKGTIYVLVTAGFFYVVLKRKEEFDYIKQEEERLSTLINSMVDFVNFKDGEGRWIEANEFALKLFQLEHVDYKGKTDSELAQYTEFYKDALYYCEVSDEEAWRYGRLSRVEEYIPLPGGEIKTFDTIKVPLFNSDGSRKGLVVIGRDITERKMAEQKLQESQQQYKSLFEYNPDVVYMMDLQGIITQLNPGFEAVTGYKRGEYIGKPIYQLVLEENRDEVRDALNKLINSGTPSMREVKLRHKDGKTLILNCTSVPMIINDTLVGVIGYGRDITEIKETEERLRKSEKLYVAGELAASIAHEIRNPLTSIKGFIQLLQSESGANQTYYNIILTELERINEIVSEFLVLAKPQDIVFRKGNIIQLLNNVILLLESQAHMDSVEIETAVQDNIPLVDCDPNQIKQVFINLIKNAIEASNIGGKIKITVGKRDKNNILIRVEDHGRGIPKERMERLGEPFFSHKERGTGLGLTVCNKIMAVHKGKLEFNSELGKGTTVDVIIPISYNEEAVK